MIQQYINAALRIARYEFVEDGQTYFASVPGLQGVWSEGATIEECRQTLAEVIEDWVWAHVRHGVEVPPVNGVRVQPDERTIATLA